MHMHLEDMESRDCALLERVGGRLTYFSCTKAAPCHVSSIVNHGSALTSLYISLEMCDRNAHMWRGDEISSVFECLQSCTALTELTVILDDCEGYTSARSPPVTIQLTPLPRLQYLHIDSHIILAQPALLCVMLTPNLTHLVLLFSQYQLVSLSDSVARQRLPHLTHCHISCICPSSSLPKGWTDEEVWCKRADSVVRWRTDRVWRRNIGLPEEQEYGPFHRKSLVQH